MMKLKHVIVMNATPSSHASLTPEGMALGKSWDARRPKIKFTVNTTSVRGTGEGGGEEGEEEGEGGSIARGGGRG